MFTISRPTVDGPETEVVSNVRVPFEFSTMPLGSASSVVEAGVSVRLETVEGFLSPADLDVQRGALEVFDDPKGAVDFLRRVAQG